MIKNIIAAIAFALVSFGAVAAEPATNVEAVQAVQAAKSMSDHEIVYALLAEVEARFGKDGLESWITDAEFDLDDKVSVAHLANLVRNDKFLAAAVGLR